MKKYKKILFIFLVIIIIILGIILYKNISIGNSENKNEKILAEIEFLEKKLVTLLNEMNNIESRNYNLSVSEINESSNSKEGEKENQEGNNDSNSEQTKTNEEDEKNKNQEEQQEQQENSNSESSNNNKTSGEEEKNEEYTLKQTGVLTNTEDIDWEHIKTEVENLYLTIPTITLDLYQEEIAKEDILGLNQELDNLTKAVKEENKETALSVLSKLYEFVSKFADKIANNENYKGIIATKNELFKAYSKLDSKNWQEISKDVTKTIETYSARILNTNNNSNKQDLANKIYIMLNELQNAVNLQDEAIFLIKYKNILEDMNNM